MAFVHRLLGPSTPLPVSGGDQALEQVIDLGTSRSVAIQVRKIAGDASEPYVYLQHAAVLDAEAFAKFTAYDGSLYAVGQSTLITYSGVLRYLMWTAAASTSDPRLAIDVVAREDEGVAGAHFRLQDLHTINANEPQRIEAAIDVLNYRTLTVQVRRVVAGPSDSQLYLQHAAELDEDSFFDVAPSWALNATGSLTKTFNSLLRYVRWRGARGTGGTAPQFLVDVIARGV